MLTRVYLPPFLTALFGGLFVFGGILSFGNSLVFDRLFFAIVLFTAIVCHNNINIVSLLVIILVQRLVEELAWIGLQDAYIVKEMLYCLTLAVIVYLRFDPITKLIRVVLGLVVTAEIYWFLTGYDAPEIYWHVVLINICLFSRYLIFSRLSIVDKLFPGKGKSTNLDWTIYKLLGLTIIVQSAMLLEYLLRHILGLNKVLVIYYAYSYIVHAIAIFSIWATFNESYKQLLPRLLRA